MGCHCVVSQKASQQTHVVGLASYNFATFEASVGDARGIRASTALIYGDYFKVLGVRPAAGRLLQAAETTFDSDPLRAVITVRSSLLSRSSYAARVGGLLRHARSRRGARCTSIRLRRCGMNDRRILHQPVLFASFL